MDTVQNIIDTCQTCVSQQAPAAQSCCDATPACDSSICITFIICLFVLLLCIVLAILLYKMRKKQLKIRKEEKEAERKHEIDMMNKQLEAKKEEEKKLYRSQLVNFLEKCAITTETTTEYGREKEKKERTIDSTAALNYINELKKLAKDLTPTDPKA